MSGWEAWVNLALDELNQAHASGRIAPDEYRRNRRQLLAKAAMHMSDRSDTQRRRAGLRQPARPRPAGRRGRVQSAFRSWALGLWVGCMMLGAAALYWYWVIRD